MKLFRASAHDRNTKWNFFALLHTTETPNETFSMLLHTSETPNGTFSCFCTRQKHKRKCKITCNVTMLYLFLQNKR
ncbi:hypothetical protein HMPREF9420_0173 [Segatella salivae DSM 15606]|uniref:Uncharacterized protein n=1 Tax=Segatella salivae DSM 15606 TaxID=888832 RepID=E6ML06_9BACT|nr:hypothetical protein HMPREF9420_0173 [Segatella salivae DSM 15606]